MNRSTTNFSQLGGGTLPHIQYTRAMLLIAQTEAGPRTLTKAHRKYGKVHWTHIRNGYGATWWLREQLSAFYGRMAIHAMEADPQVCKCMHWHTNADVVDAEYERRVA